MTPSSTAKAAAAAILFAAACAVVTGILDLYVFRSLDMAALDVMAHLDPDVAPLWLSTPRLIVYTVLGVLFARWHRGSLLVGAVTYAVLVVVYFLRIRYSGLWWADDWYARLVTWAPLAAPPVAIGLGVLLGSRIWLKRPA